MPTAYTDASLKAEAQSDPMKLGVAAAVAARDFHRAAALLNAPTQAAYLPVPAPTVLLWASGQPGLLTNLAAAASASGPFAPGGASDIAKVAGARDAAQAVLYLLGGGYPSLSIDSPIIAGATDAAGAIAYTPGAGAVAIPGRLDVLVSARVMVDASGAPLKDALLSLGKSAVSRAFALWGATAPTIDADRIMAALRS